MGYITGTILAVLSAPAFRSLFASEPRQEMTSDAASTTLRIMKAIRSVRVSFICW